MFRFGRVLQMANRALPVRPTHLGPAEARAALIEGCKEVLKEIETLPEDYAYRTDIGKLYAYRLKVAEEETDVRKIEELIAGGEINDLVRIARDEKSLIPELVRAEPWDISGDVDYETDDEDWVPFERKIYHN